jgi:hypothetical protein
MSNQSAASTLHGPIATTAFVQGISSPSTVTPVTALPLPPATVSVSILSTVPMRSSAPAAVCNTGGDSAHQVKL